MKLNTFVFCSKKRTRRFLNTIILSKIPGEITSYISIDSIICDDPEECLQFLCRLLKAKNKF